MSYEERAPYYSTRVRVADVTSPKDLAGLKEFTCEIVYGNQEVKVVATNVKDVADIKEKAIFDEMEQVFAQRDEWAKKRNFTFVDTVDVAKLISLGKGSK